jgi:hypothetical protein
MIGKIEKGSLIFKIKMQEPKLSLSGKSMVVASSRGPRKSSLKIDGKPIYVNANAYIRVEGPAQATKAKKKTTSKESRLRASTKGGA